MLITESELSPRVVRCLKRNNVVTVDDLPKSICGLLLLRGLGVAAALEIVKAYPLPACHETDVLPPGKAIDRAIAISREVNHARCS
jgi:hypothetical protein